MAAEDDSIERAAAERRERIGSLRAARELFDTPDGDSMQAEDKKNDQDENGEETWVYLTILLLFNHFIICIVFFKFLLVHDIYIYLYYFVLL